MASDGIRWQLQHGVFYTPPFEYVLFDVGQLPHEFSRAIELAVQRIAHRHAHWTRPFSLGQTRLRLYFAA